MLNGISLPRQIDRFSDLTLAVRDVLKSQHVQRPCDLHQRRDQMALQFLCWMGCRAEELCSLKRVDVDMASNKLTFVRTKSGHPQQMPIPTEFREPFYTYLLSLPKNETFVFFSETGRKMTRRSLLDLVKTHAEYVGINVIGGVYTRMIRRTDANFLRAFGASDQLIEYFLRHRPSVAKEHYAPVMAEDIAPAFEFHPIRKLGLA